MNIGDKVEVSVSGRITGLEEDIWNQKPGVKRLIYKVKVGDGPLSYTVNVPIEAMVQAEVAP